MKMIANHKYYQLTRGGVVIWRSGVLASNWAYTLSLPSLMRRGVRSSLEHSTNGMNDVSKYFDIIGAEMESQIPHVFAHDTPALAVIEMVVDSELVLVFAENAERTVSELLDIVSPVTLVEKSAVLTSRVSTNLTGNSCGLFVVLNSRIRTCVMEFILMAMKLRLIAWVALDDL
jgi:hypothetical protein